MVVSLPTLDLNAGSRHGIFVVWELLFECLSLLVTVNEGLTVTRHRPQYNGILDAVRRIRAQEGIQGLYKGLVPNVWGAGMAWGFYFLL